MFCLLDASSEGSLSLISFINTWQIKSAFSSLASHKQITLDALEKWFRTSSYKQILVGRIHHLINSYVKLMLHSQHTSSRPGEFHPKPLTEPYVIVSHHTALLKWYTKIAHPFSSWQAVYQISSSLCSISITETSSLLRMSPPLFQTSLFCL